MTAVACLVSVGCLLLGLLLGSCKIVIRLIKRSAVLDSGSLIVLEQIDMKTGV